MFRVVRDAVTDGGIRWKESDHSYTAEEIVDLLNSQELLSKFEAVDDSEVTIWCSITWSDWGRGTSKVRTEGSTVEEAREKAENLAIACGWTPRRWYQWWRWNE